MPWLNAADIDIGSAAHFVAVPPDRDDEPVREFASFTADLHRLADWLDACSVDTVAMESTGVCWIALYELLETRSPRVGPGQEARTRPQCPKVRFADTALPDVWRGPHPHRRHRCDHRAGGGLRGGGRHGQVPQRQTLRLLAGFVSGDQDHWRQGHEWQDPSAVPTALPTSWPD